MVKLRELKDIKRNPYKEIIPKLTRTKLSSRYVSLSLDREVFNDYIKDLTTTQLGHLMKLIYYLGDEYVVKDMEGKEFMDFYFKFKSSVLDIINH